MIAEYRCASRSRWLLGWYTISTGALGLFGVAQAISAITKALDPTPMMQATALLGILALMFAACIAAGSAFLLRRSWALSVLGLVSLAQTPAWEGFASAYHFLGGVYLFIGMDGRGNWLLRGGWQVGGVIGIQGNGVSQFWGANVIPAIILAVAYGVEHWSGVVPHQLARKM